MTRRGIAVLLAALVLGGAAVGSTEAAAARLPVTAAPIQVWDQAVDPPDRPVPPGLSPDGTLGPPAALPPVTTAGPPVTTPGTSPVTGTTPRPPVTPPTAPGTPDEPAPDPVLDGLGPEQGSVAGD